MSQKKTKVQKIADYLAANGTKTSGDVIRHFKDRSMKVTYGEIATARRKSGSATSSAAKKPKLAVARAAHAVSAPRGASGDGPPAVSLAVDLIEKLGGVSAAKRVIEVVERIRALPA